MDVASEIKLAFAFIFIVITVLMTNIKNDSTPINEASSTEKAVVFSSSQPVNPKKSMVIPVVYKMTCLGKCNITCKKANECKAIDDTSKAYVNISKRMQQESDEKQIFDIIIKPKDKNSAIELSISSCKTNTKINLTRIVDFDSERELTEFTCLNKNLKVKYENGNFKEMKNVN